MGNRTATNEERTISTKGTVDCAQATVHTFHWVEAKKSFEGFDNSITSDHLLDGTKTTTIAGEPIWVLPSRLGPTSGPAHPGMRGLLSHKAPFGEAEAILGSSTCYAEGKPVVRMFDLTFQDNRNTIGQVLPSPKPLSAILAKGKGGDAAAGDGKGKGKGGKADKRKRRSGVPDWPATSAEPVERCEVTAMVARCAHGRDPKDGYIEITHIGANNPQVQEALTLRAGVNGICGKPHPVWKVAGQAQPAGSEPLELVWLPPPVMSGPLRGWPKIEDRPSQDVVITCDGCVSRGHELKVRVYEAISGKNIRDIKELLDPMGLAYALLEGINGVIGCLADEVNGQPPGYTPPTGSMEVAAAVQEDPNSHEVFVWYKVRADFNPLVGIRARITLGLGTVAKLVKRFKRLAKVLGFVESWQGGRLEKWGKKIVEGMGGGLEAAGDFFDADWMREAGKVIAQFDPGKMVDCIVAAGAFVEVDNWLTFKGEVQRTRPHTRGTIIDPIGFDGRKKESIGLELGVLNGLLFDLELSGSGSGAVHGGRVGVDDVGVYMDGPWVEITQLYARLRLTLLGGFIKTYKEYMDDNDVEQPDTLDLLPWVPERAKQALKKYKDTKIYVLQFDGTGKLAL